MRLWTTMPARVYKETIEKTGIYQCDPDKSEVLTWDDSGRQFANAYDWMSRYMTEKIGPHGVEMTKNWTGTIIRIWKERKNSRKSPGTGYSRSIRLLMCRQLSGSLEKKRSKRSGSTTNKPSVWAVFFSAGEKYLLLSICLKSAAHILDPVF